MRDLDKALADIFAIRSQIAAGTAFRGYGPAAVAATGGLGADDGAHSVSLARRSDRRIRWPSSLAGSRPRWSSAGIIGIEMRARSHRHHSGLADAMIHQAVEQLLPAGVAGVAAAVMLWQFAPETLWMLPGLWQLLVGLGVFASVRSLPRTVRLGGRLVLRRRHCGAAARQATPTRCRPGWARRS